MPRPICFMIMPYATKPTGAPAGVGAPEKVNFDRLWDAALRPAIDQAGYEPVRRERGHRRADHHRDDRTSRDFRPRARRRLDSKWQRLLRGGHSPRRAEAGMHSDRRGLVETAVRYRPDAPDSLPSSGGNDFRRHRRGDPRHHRGGDPDHGGWRITVLPGISELSQLRGRARHRLQEDTPGTVGISGRNHRRPFGDRRGVPQPGAGSAATVLLRWPHPESGRDRTAVHASRLYRLAHHQRIHR